MLRQKGICGHLWRAQKIKKMILSLYFSYVFAIIQNFLKIKKIRSMIFSMKNLGFEKNVYAIRKLGRTQSHALPILVEINISPWMMKVQQKLISKIIYQMNIWNCWNPSKHWQKLYIL